MTNLDSILKSRGITLLTNVHLVKAMVFPVVMYGCESWAIKKLDHQRIDAFELWWWSPLDCNIKPVNSKGSQSWIFIGRTDGEAETPILWPSDVENWVIWKDPDAGKDWKQEKGTTEDETVGWHHPLDGHESEQALGVGDGQGSLACCSPWGCRVWHDWVTELNWYREFSSETEFSFLLFFRYDFIHFFIFSALPLLPRGLFSSCGRQSYFLLRCAGFPPWRLPSLQRRASAAASHGFQQLRPTGSAAVLPTL